ncbi:ESPR-type extended signal peptide-containing protein, partial [Burkholderia ubonensis]|uniref:ESPR-type extended signal peptide-containing protein n=1 Tax=Burkholderia ubonensis TaxID=101571 RepID=UPI0039F53D0B
MNKIYRTVWNKALGAFVAASELDCSQGKGKAGVTGGGGDERVQTLDGPARGAIHDGIANMKISTVMPVRSSMLTPFSVAIHCLFGAMFISGYAHAGALINCTGAGTATGSNTANPSGNVGWIAPITAACGNANGVYLQESPGGGGASIAIGNALNSTPGAIVLTAPNGITLSGQTSLSNNKITNLTAGTAPTDAVNVSQLTSLSTSVSTNISTAQSGVNSLSTGLSTTNSTVASLSTSASTGISTAQSGVNSLSTGLSTTNSTVASLSTGISTTSSTVVSLSTGLSTTNSNVASLSTSTSTGLSTTNS